MTVKFKVIILLTLTMLCANGCAGLSLFSSTHTHKHYNESPETEVKINKLESRIINLEALLKKQNIEASARK